MMPILILHNKAILSDAYFELNAHILSAQADPLEDAQREINDQCHKKWFEGKQEHKNMYLVFYAAPR